MQDIKIIILNSILLYIQEFHLRISSLAHTAWLSLPNFSHSVNIQQQILRIKRSTSFFSFVLLLYISQKSSDVVTLTCFKQDIELPPGLMEQSCHVLMCWISLLHSCFFKSHSRSKHVVLNSPTQLQVHCLVEQIRNLWHPQLISFMNSVRLIQRMLWHLK